MVSNLSCRVHGLVYSEDRAIVDIGILAFLASGATWQASRQPNLIVLWCPQAHHRCSNLLAANSEICEPNCDLLYLDMVKSRLWITLFYFYIKYCRRNQSGCV